MMPANFPGGGVKFSHVRAVNQVWPAHHAKTLRLKSTTEQVRAGK